MSFDPRIIVMLLVAPAVLLVIGVIIATMIGKKIRRQCPACLQKSLKQVSVVRAMAIEKGQETPDYRAYFRCESCGTRFKKHNGVFSGVPEDEMPEATRFG